MESGIMRRVSSFFRFFVLGGFIFWFPDVILHAIRGHSFAGIDMAFLTLLLPATTIGGFAILWRMNRNRSSCAFVALSLLLGILVQGPVYMAMGLSFAVGAFLKMGALKFLRTVVLILPIALLEMSTYDGTLFAVGLVIVGLVLLAVGIPKRFFDWVAPKATESASE